MTRNSGKRTIEQTAADVRHRVQRGKHDGSSGQIPVQPSALVELAGTAENWLQADNRKLRIRCIDYEAEIFKRLQMLDYHEAAIVRGAFSASLQNNG